MTARIFGCRVTDLIGILVNKLRRLNPEKQKHVEAFMDFMASQDEER